jgi:hypothetical protein
MHGIAGLSGRPAKPRVFVSYHHDNDQCYADRFTRLFDSSYDVLTDRSLREPIKSADPDYTYQRLRDDFISGSSCTIVLCGSETCNRKYVDWEIKATLDKHHGLLGLLLPTHRPSFDGSYVVPNRLYDNIQSGYAHWMSWTDNVHLMVIGINAALERAKNTRLIVNSRSMMGRNR